MPDQVIERLRVALIHAHDEKPSFRTRTIQALKSCLSLKNKIVIRLEFKKKNAA